MGSQDPGKYMDIDLCNEDIGACPDRIGNCWTKVPVRFIQSGFARYRGHFGVSNFVSACSCPNNRIVKFRSWGNDGKLVILIQKIKVKKWNFNSYFRENKSNLIGVYIA